MPGAVPANRRKAELVHWSYTGGHQRWFCWRFLQQLVEHPRHGNGFSGQAHSVDGRPEHGFRALGLSRLSARPRAYVPKEWKHLSHKNTKEGRQSLMEEGGGGVTRDAPQGPPRTCKRILV